MHVLRMTVRLAVGDCKDARDREARLTAIAARLRGHFNVAVAHGGVPGSGAEGWLAFVTLAPKPRDAQRTLEGVVEALKAHPDCRLAATPELTAL